MELPKIHTQEIQDKQDAEAWKNGNERDRILQVLKAFSSSRSLPTTDDYARVHREATEDFRRNDYGEAQQHVDTLTELVEFYKDLAENYLDTLTGHGIIPDEYGGADNHPFALTRAGEQVFGRIEVFRMEDHSPEDLWEHYYMPLLKIATDSEREWIAEQCPDQVAELSQE